MKKLIALALAIIMMTAMALPAFAADDISAEVDDHYAAENELNDENQEGDVYVLYTVSSKYTVLIPDNVMFSETHGFKFLADIAATNVRIGNGQQLTVSVTSENSYKMMPKKDDQGNFGAGNRDGVPYTIGFFENVEYNDGNNKFAWPAEVANNKLSTELAKRSGYEEAVGAGATTVLTIDGTGNSIERSGTTLIFFLPNQEDTLGEYIDKLTFKVNLG